MPLRELVTQAFDDQALRRIHQMGEQVEASDSPLCFSLYLPMESSDAEHNWLQLKNGISAISRELSEAQTETYSEILRALRASLSEQRTLYMPDGTIGIFACSAGSASFFFEGKHAFRFTVAPYFDLVPFVQLSRGIAPIYMVALSQRSVRLFRLHGQCFERIGAGQLPEQLEDVLGHELDTARYFSALDSKLRELVDDSAPVVLMGTPDIVSLFREQSSFKDAQLEYVVHGSPAHLRDEELRAHAIDARAQMQQAWSQAESEDLQQRVDRNELVTNPNKLAKAAREGRVLALYVGERMAKSRRMAGKHARRVIDLSNRSVAELARQVLRLGGRIRSLPPGFRTPHGARVAAVLRY